MHLLACIYQGRLSAGCHQSTVPATPGTAGQGLYCNSLGKEEPPHVPLPHLQHCHWAQPHFSLNPLPADSSAIALKSFQSRNNFCCILTNLSLSLVCEQSHIGGWQIDRVLKGKLFFTPLNTCYRMGCESWVLQQSYFAPYRTCHTCCNGSPALCPAKHYLTLVLSPPWAGAGTCFSLPGLIWGNSDDRHLSACH